MHISSAQRPRALRPKAPIQQPIKASSPSELEAIDSFVGSQDRFVSDMVLKPVPLGVMGFGAGASLLSYGMTGNLNLAVVSGILGAGFGLFAGSIVELT